MYFPCCLGYCSYTTPFMANFDVSKNWIILADLPAREAAGELARYISLLRKNAGAGPQQPQILINGSKTALLGCVPVIVLNAAEESPDKNGFSWQLGSDRLEISGDSLRGLWNGLFDFLAALGFKWAGPGQEELPKAAAKDSSSPDIVIYALNKNDGHCPSKSLPQERKRFFIWKKLKKKEKEELVKWAARNKYDALVFSLKEKSFWAGAGNGGLYGAKKFAFIIEAGGSDLSMLLPRRLFLLNRGLFRMELGKRKLKHHFCSTNPQTIMYIIRGARKFFCRTIPGVTAPRVFHLLPDRGYENIWCTCPACRAFNPAEQNIMAVNSVAAQLASIDSLAFLSFLDFGAAKGEPGSSEIAPEKNMFTLGTMQNDTILRH